MSEIKNGVKFNTTIVRAFKLSNGSFMSADLDSEAFDKVQSEIRMGGRLILKPVKTKKNDNSPDAYFEVMAVEDVEEFKKKYTRKKETQDSEDVL